VLFFAGPTGTGKTETAKTLAEKLFGDEKCCIRFDMSEYGQAHSDQKLLGAPPGYVGYEAGGQLTNAVKNNPFSILLFDEIEKAHPSILDKFLQILEDGRMTDGQGNTVYFSETIIIFTSNLGIYQNTITGERKQVVTPDLAYEEVQTKVREGIEHYFKLELGRPEILNRIGENIVVFDFIREDVADEILTSQINRICINLRTDKNIYLEISDQAHQTLLSKAIDNLDNGGRGIGNIVESLLVNPLSRHMFDNEIFSDKHILISGIDTSERITKLICSVGD
jgi:ATP-dependent Clp protease ATP-binding subunit ClpA